MDLEMLQIQVKYLLNVAQARLCPQFIRNKLLKFVFELDVFICHVRL